MLRGFVAALLLFLSACSTIKPWPPEVGEPYPDLELFDESGTPVRLSELRGNVLLVEPIRMACSACQSFTGSQRWGPFGAVLPQAGLVSLEQLLDNNAPGVKTTKRGLQVVQIVFFNMDGQPPRPADLRAWSKHFHLHERNILVLGANKEAADQTARMIIPGFQLVDKEFVLRADATGSSPEQDLNDELLPLIPHLITE